MAEFSSSGGSGADNDVYTLLVAIAFLALLIGAGYLWYSGSGMFGGSFPLSNATSAVIDLARTATHA